MESLPALETVMQMMTCDCCRSACGGLYQCRGLDLDCPDLCNCAGNCEFSTASNNTGNDKDTEVNGIECKIHFFHKHNLYKHI